MAALLRLALEDIDEEPRLAPALGACAEAAQLIGGLGLRDELRSRRDGEGGGDLEELGDAQAAAAGLVAGVGVGRPAEALSELFLSY